MSPRELRRRWRDFDRLRRSLFEEGGAVIESSGDARGRPGALDARTVVQPDGDVLWFVHADVAGDADVLRAHAESVARWYGDSSRSMAALGAQLKAFRVAGSGMGVAVVAVLTPADLWSLWSPLVAVAAQPLAGGVTGSLLRRGMGALFP